MDRLTELAERYGLVSPQAISETVQCLSKKRFFKLVETCEAVSADETELAPESSAMPNLLASSSFRSDSGCRDWSCRADKLALLAQYAALYSDRLIVPLYFESFTAGIETGRLALGDLYFKHFVLRPLVEVGITKFAVDLYCLCAECGKRFREICAMHDKAAFDFYASKIPEMNLVYRPPSPERSVC